MKRSVCIIKAAILLLTFISMSVNTAFALEIPKPNNLFGGLLMDGSDTILSSVAYEGGILALTRKAFYLLREGDSEARYVCMASDVQQEYPDDRPRVDLLFTDEGKLMGLNSMTGRLYQLKVNDSSIDLIADRQLQWSQFLQGEPPYEYVPAPRYIRSDYGQLYVKFQNFDDDEIESDLFRFNLATGEMFTSKVAYLEGLCPYRDGLYLAAHYDVKTSKTGYPEIVIYDPAADTVSSTEYLFPDEGFSAQIPLFYDAVRDDVYVSTPSTLYRLEANEAPVPVAAFASGYASACMTPGIAPLPNDELMITFDTNIYLREIASLGKLRQTTLKVAGYFPDQEAKSQALLDVGDVTLEETRRVDLAKLRTDLLTGTVEEDILLLESSEIDIQSLIRKGYFQSLSQSESLGEFTNQLLPGLQKLSCANDTIWMGPVSVTLSPPMFNREAFEALGKIPPKTLREMIDFTQMYVDGTYPNTGEYVLFPFADVKRQLKRFACELYIDQQIALGVKTLVIEKLKPVINAIESLDLSGTVALQSEGSEGLGLAASPESLMELNARYNLLDAAQNRFHFAPFAVRLDADSPALFHATARFIAIPAQSKNAAKALQFVQAYSKHLDAGTRAMLCPFAAEPVKDERYAKQMEEYSEKAARYRQLEKQAEGNIVMQHREMAEYFENKCEEIKAMGIELLRDEDLLVNREVMQLAVFDTGAAVTVRNSVFAETAILDQFLDGAITLEQWIGEVNARMKMAYLEAE